MTVSFLDGPVGVDRGQDVCFRVSHDLFLSVLQFSVRTVLRAGAASADPICPVSRGRNFTRLEAPRTVRSRAWGPGAASLEPQLNLDRSHQMADPLRLAAQLGRNCGP